uniref:OSJNBa0065J03.8 protein n=1 Tax=Oryza sativa subsp. japonica TaxID=39947 RepID=Q7XVW3_ORYSJ|nr:OSJNBa0065J03.8 [Oryza sativa Japonica Group]
MGATLKILEDNKNNARQEGKACRFTTHVDIMAECRRDEMANLSIFVLCPRPTSPDNILAKADKAAVINSFHLSMTDEDLTGRLLTVDDHPDSDGEDAGQVLFSEKEAPAHSNKEAGQNSAGGRASSSRQPHRSRRERDGNGSDGKSGSSQAANRNVSKDKCRYCGKLGHWAKDCCKAKRDREKLAQANLLITEPAQAADEGEPTLLMAQVCELAPATDPVITDGEVTLKEERAHVSLQDEGKPVDLDWILDTGASNHMTGYRDVFSELHTTVRGTVKFGDASRVWIEGRGMVLFACKNGDHCALTSVYYIPKLRSNMVSLG